jgi:hypothetical protein
MVWNNSADSDQMGHPKLVRSNLLARAAGGECGKRDEGSETPSPFPLTASRFPSPRLPSPGETIHAAELLRPGHAQYAGG